MALHIGVLVIVEPGAFERTILPAEAERFDQMQFAAGVGAQADDVTRVGRDFGLEENDGSQKITPGSV